MLLSLKNQQEQTKIIKEGQENQLKAISRPDRSN